MPIYETNMDSQALRLFLSLADNLHFGKTSREQHVSPSALSRSIKQLEDELGAPLFLRDNRSVRLTREGAGSASRAIGRGILWFAPKFMKFLSWAGTAAMFLVGGGLSLWWFSRLP